MRIGFDTSGSVFHELTLPETTTILLSPHLMLVPHTGELQCEIRDGNVRGGTLHLLVSAEDFRRIASVGATGITSVGSLQEDLWVELTLQLNIPSLGEHASGFANVDEPLDLLFITDGIFPVLLNLQYYTAQRIEQDTQAVEAEVFLDS